MLYMCRKFQKLPYIDYSRDFRQNPGTGVGPWISPLSLKNSKNMKKSFGKIVRVKIDFVKSQGIYLESGLIEA